MSKASSLFKNILDIMASNLVTLLASVMTGLIIPKMLGATNYGYYRIFVLYMTYTALLHFGFVDGILLIDGGKNYNELNKNEYRSNSMLFIFIQFCIMILFIIISLFIRNNIYAFLFLMIGIGTFLVNVTTYYRFISQIIMYFKRLSIFNSIQSILLIILTLLMWIIYNFKIIKKYNYKFYILITVFVYFIMFIIYMTSYINITIGKHDSYILAIYRFIRYCKSGIYLTIAFQISNLIMIIDNQFVSVLFKTSTYGKYSFAYSMTNTAITVLSAVATVLLPHLKRDTYTHIIQIYDKMISSIMLVVYFALLSYFPLCILIRIILPEYMQSLSYLKIFLPELGITCSVTMITFNYYNALGKSKFYFYLSLYVLIISIIIDSTFYILFHSSVLLALGSFISIFIWYVLSEYFLVKWYHIKWIRNFIYMTLMICSFFIMSSINNIYIGFCGYLFIYIIISVFMLKNIILHYFYIWCNKFKGE